MSKKKSEIFGLRPELRFGEQIRQLRLENNYSTEEIFSRIKISPDFISNLENENWNALPAYAFSRGLLINLLEFYQLGNTEQKELLKKFSAIINGEQDVSTSLEANKEQNKKSTILEGGSVPAEFSIPKHSKKNSEEVIMRLSGDKEQLNDEEKLQKNFSAGRNLAIVSGLLLIVIIILWYFSPFTFTDQDANVGVNASLNQEDEKKFYSLYNSYDTFDLVADDTVKIFFDNQIFSFRLAQVVNTFDNQVVANFELDNEKIVKVYLFGESWVDIDEDGNSDLLIKFQKQSGEIALVFFSLLKKAGSDVNFEAIWNNQEKTLVEKGEKILLKNQNKIPIQIFIKATTLPAHLAYNIDGQRQNTLMLRPGNNLNLVANEHVELQIGNFRSVILVINYIPLKLYIDKPNQFGITKIVKWLPSIRNETKYDLIIKDFVE